MEQSEADRSKGISEARTARRGRDDRYTRVAIVLHWTIAVLIIWNLLSGFLVWDIAKEWFQENRAFYFFGLTSHLSSGLTVLVLTVVRIAWRLMHEPPPYPDDMKQWERHASHFAHFFLYAAMILMPLTGWSILSAHPPEGSPGQQVERAALAAALPAPPPGAGAAGPPPGPPPSPPRIWWVGPPLPAIPPIANIGKEPGGVEPQDILHDEFVEWHEIGGILTLLLLLLHVAAALKHQWIDRHPELQRMGLGNRR